MSSIQDPGADKLQSAIRSERPIFTATIDAAKQNTDAKLFWDSVRAIGKSALQDGRLSPAASPEEVADYVLSNHSGELAWLLNKSVADPYQRMAIARAGLAVAPQIPVQLGDDAALAKEFRETGFLKLPELLTPAQVDEMYRYFAARNEFLITGPTYNNTIQDVVSAPHALALAAHPRLLALASDFIGGPATIVDICVWFTIPNEGEEYGGHVFHRDKDDFRACKMFMYLTDVESDNGPHVFARYTHDPEHTQELLRSRGVPQDIVPALYAGNGRNMAGAIQKIFDDQIFEITGKAGTSFIEGTYGFHRGSAVRGRRRGLFQVLYATVPYPHRLERLAPVALDRLPPDCVDNELTRYATRLLFKPH